MTLHNKEKFNPPGVISALKAHGLKTHLPCQLADAFRLGWLAAQPDWKPQRCENCNCEHGQADCNEIKEMMGGDNNDQRH